MNKRPNSSRDTPAKDTMRRKQALIDLSPEQDDNLDAPTISITSTKPTSTKSARDQKFRADDDLSTSRLARPRMARVSSTPPAITTQPPVLVACDKLVLNVPVEARQLDVVVQRANELVKEGTLVRSSSKGKFYRHNYKLKFKGGGMAYVAMTPMKPTMKTQMQITFNPNPSHMQHSDALLLKETMKSLLPIEATRLARAMRFQRIDVCADSHNLIDDLIIHLDGTKVGSKIFVETGTGGKLQTVYMGAKDSPHHGIAYDQQQSDEYKAKVGEHVRRTALRQNAQLVLEQKNTTLRIESRRVFKKPVTLAQLGEMENVFAGYRVYEVKPGKGVVLTAAFLGYLDCVRIRGINGARRWLSDHAEDKRAAKATVQAHEQTLQRMAVEWWQPADFSRSLLETLKQSPAWPFLRVMATPR